MDEYILKEENGALSICKGDGTVLISLTDIPKNGITVTYYNADIMKRWEYSPDYVEEFGKEFKSSINCKDKQEQSLCRTRLMNLISSTMLVGMDMVDLERAMSLGGEGMYYHYEIGSESLESVGKKIEEQLDKENVHFRSGIVCVEGYRSTIELDPLCEYFGAYIQLLYSETDNTLIDIWLFQ